jgi:hypothetical protein
VRGACQQFRQGKCRNLRGESVEIAGANRPIRHRHIRENPPLAAFLRNFPHANAMNCVIYPRFQRRRNLRFERAEFGNPCAINGLAARHALQR